MVDLVMRGSVKMLADQGWDGVKFDSCSMFHNLTKWAELINATGRPVLIENCHQGAYTPGMQQWQGCATPCTPFPCPKILVTPAFFSQARVFIDWLSCLFVDGRYVKNASASSGFSHFLGMFFGMGDATPLPHVSYADCKTHCESLKTNCTGFTFVSDDPAPAATAPIDCFLKARAQPNHMDLSNSNYCTGADDPSDCPFNLCTQPPQLLGLPMPAHLRPDLTLVAAACRPCLG